MLASTQPGSPTWHRKQDPTDIVGLPANGVHIHGSEPQFIRHCYSDLFREVEPPKLSVHFGVKVFPARSFSFQRAVYSRKVGTRGAGKKSRIQVLCGREGAGVWPGCCYVPLPDSRPKRRLQGHRHGPASTSSRACDAQPFTRSVGRNRGDGSGRAITEHRPSGIRRQLPTGTRGALPN